MFSSIGVTELLIVLIVALIVLGPKKLPEVGRSLGNGMREFKDSIAGISLHNDDDDEEERTLRADTPPAAVKVEEPVVK
jgi:sec-independent protein translocase protein TatA